MKKFVLLLVVSLAILGLASCIGSEGGYAVSTARETATKVQGDTANTAVNTIPVPQVSYFQERRTIAAWTKYWDKPKMPCFVYLVSFGQVIGYYVTDGKPAATTSYLCPEETIVNDPYGSSDAGGQAVTAPDVDGTWGNNNPGIRFFTASGIPVEWGGEGATYIYSGAPLPLNVPCLGK